MFAIPASLRVIGTSRRPKQSSCAHSRNAEPGAGSCRGGMWGVVMQRQEGTEDGRGVPLRYLGWMDLELPGPAAIKPRSHVITLVAKPPTSPAQCQCQDVLQRGQRAPFCQCHQKRTLLGIFLLLRSISPSFPPVPPEKGFPLNKVTPWAVSITALGRGRNEPGRSEGTAERQAVKLHSDLFQDAAGILSPVYSCALLLTPRRVRTDVKCGSVKFISA